jgi:hypothetical protein
VRAVLEGGVSPTPKAPEWARAANGATLTTEQMKAERFVETRERMARHFPGRTHWELGVLARLERSRVNASWKSKQATTDERKGNLLGADAAALKLVLEQVWQQAIPLGTPDAHKIDLDNMPF